MVFDEVDRGVGGAVADAVGERLQRLAETTQVLLVTHSPQVAARAARHFRISRVKDKTRSSCWMTISAWRKSPACCRAPPSPPRPAPPPSG
jgi:DNA repair ATPase RecN